MFIFNFNQSKHHSTKVQGHQGVGFGGTKWQVWKMEANNKDLEDSSVQEFSNIPLEHTPDHQPTVYEAFLFIWGFRDAWGMLQGYVGVLLESGWFGMILEDSFCWIESRVDEDKHIKIVLYPERFVSIIVA